MPPFPKSRNRRCHSDVLFILRNFLFIWVPSYTCQILMLLQAYFNEDNAYYSHTHFPKTPPPRACWSRSLGCAAGVGLLLGFPSSHWCLVQQEDSELLPDSKFSLLHSQNGVSQAEAQPWADVFFTSKFVRCQIGGAAAIATLLNFLNDISKSLYSPCVWLAFTSTLKSSSAYYPAKN